MERGARPPRAATPPCSLRTKPGKSGKSVLLRYLSVKQALGALFHRGWVKRGAPLARG